MKALTIKILHVSLAVLLVISTMGVTVEKHYCMGKLKSMAIFQQADNCFGGTSKMTELKDLTIHRSCLNTDEALDLFNKKFIQSSLEFYNPMTKTVMGDRLRNKAQSLSELTINKKVQVNLNLVKF